MKTVLQCILAASVLLTDPILSWSNSKMISDVEVLVRAWPSGATTAYPTVGEQGRLGTIIDLFSDLANNILNTMVNAAGNTFGVVGISRPPYAPAGEPQAAP
ncbi:hypothetical protein V5799_008959 [Amblyomma americanum]|uniref:Secreted protein n=1 Tax=Amblyomma americanum TaxID=6943 RepID=A0AAQ4FCF8_AMBAM